MVLRVRPTKEEVERLPAFEELTLDQITPLRTTDQFREALEAMRTGGVVGFDTESKPTFTKDAVPDGPHVVQFALPDRAFVVQIGANPPIDFLREVLQSEQILKVGFGVRSDRGPLHRKLGITLAAGLELATPLRALQYRQALGAKAAVAIVLGRRLAKPRKMTTSNWARASLMPAQIIYAANDAYAALRIYMALAERGLTDDIVRSSGPSGLLENVRNAAEEPVGVHVH